MKKFKDKYLFIGYNHLLNIILKSFKKIIFNPLKYINRCDFHFTLKNMFTKVNDLCYPMSKQKWNVIIDSCMEPVGLQYTVFIKV